MWLPDLEHTNLLIFADWLEDRGDKKNVFFRFLAEIRQEIDVSRKYWDNNLSLVCKSVIDEEKLTIVQFLSETKIEEMQRMLKKANGNRKRLIANMDLVASMIIKHVMEPFPETLTYSYGFKSHVKNATMIKVESKKNQKCLVKIWNINET